MSTRALRAPIALLVTIAFLSSLSGCVTDPYTGERKLSRAALLGAIGLGAGAGIGALAGRNKARAAAIGGGIGALAGAAVGAYMDAQERKLRDQLEETGVSVTRNGHEILLNMPGNITFATDSAQIRSEFTQVLDSVALVLEEYEKTIIEVMGHTDSTGSAEYNLRLSRSRAEAVASYLRKVGVEDARILSQGFGEEYPVADNDSPEGRQENRRVELRLVPLTDPADDPE